MKTTVMFLVTLLAIIAITTMSGCIDDAPNDAGNATRGDASNDTNTTLSNASDGLCVVRMKHISTGQGRRLGLCRSLSQNRKRR
ncbi:MAG: hypothetical protein U9N36_09000 [Euryarchaeota archaeon]|nr:hypothetical protein [Euryarchaeota archaeon]